MPMPRWVVLSGVSVLTVSGLLMVRANADPPQSEAAQYAISHPECSYFGSDHEKVTNAALKGVGRSLNNHPLSDRTIQVMQAMNYVPPGSPTYSLWRIAPGRIDRFLHLGRFSEEWHYSGAAHHRLGIRPPRDIGSDRPHSHAGRGFGLRQRYYSHQARQLH